MKYKFRNGQQVISFTAENDYDATTQLSEIVKQDFSDTLFDDWFDD